MKKKPKNTIKYKMLKRIRSSRGSVVLFSDFTGLGDVYQISRMLKNCVDTGLIVRLGKGVYAKTEKNPYSDKPIIRNGFDVACLEALDRLGVKYEASRATKRYNERKSEQVPAHLKVRLKSRCRRSFSYRAGKLYFEDNINAR